MNITPKAIFTSTQSHTAYSVHSVHSMNVENPALSFEKSDKQKGEKRAAPKHQWWQAGVLSCLILLVLLMPLTANSSDQLVKMRIGQAADKTRIVFDLSQMPKYQLQTLSNPSRILIQFKNTQNRLSFNKKFLNDSRLFSINVTHDDAATQVELGLHASYAVKPFTLGKNREGYERLVVDLFENAGQSSPASKGDGKLPTPQIASAAIEKPVVQLAKAEQAESPKTPKLKQSADIRIDSGIDSEINLGRDSGINLEGGSKTDSKAQTLSAASPAIVEPSKTDLANAQNAPNSQNLNNGPIGRAIMPSSAEVVSTRAVEPVSQTESVPDLKTLIAQMPVEQMTKEQIRAELIKLVNATQTAELSPEATKKEGVNAAKTETQAKPETTPELSSQRAKATSLEQTAEVTHAQEKAPELADTSELPVEKLALDSTSGSTRDSTPNSAVNSAPKEVHGQVRLEVNKQAVPKEPVTETVHENVNKIVHKTQEESPAAEQPSVKLAPKSEVTKTAETAITEVAEQSVAKQKAAENEAVQKSALEKSPVVAAQKPKPALPSLLNQSKPSDDILVVAIDAGHGGKDTGAIGPNNSYEKDATLRIAKRIKVLIDRVPGMKAVLTRDKDVFIPLYDRVKIAKQNEADIFISLHADAFHDHSVQGGSVYVLSERGASSTMARLLAKKENASFQTIKLATKDDDVVYAISDMSREANIRASRKLAKSVLDAMRRDILVHRHSVQSANFAVLKSIEMPSLLVETAFISNPHEERKLNDPKFQNKVAKSVVNGVKSFVSSFADQPRWGEKLFVHYRVKKGDTLTKIAENYQVSVAELKRLNKITNPNRLYVGKLVKIPVNEDLLVAS